METNSGSVINCEVNKCDKCGKVISLSGSPVNHNNSYCACSIDDKQMIIKPKGLYGWICPICGTGLSPFTTVCPCNQPKYKITC